MNVAGIKILTFFIRLIIGVTTTYTLGRGIYLASYEITQSAEKLL